MLVAMLRNNISKLFVRTGERFQPVDGLRALSVLWIFFFHITFMLGEALGRDQFMTLIGLPQFRWSTHGLIGVDMFFVISGFLIGSLLIEEHERTGSIAFGRFYVRRFMRLCPVYFFVAALLLGHNAFIEEIRDSPSEYAWANFLYVNNFVPVAKQFMPWSWSLAIEEQFYLVCPAFILLLHRARLSPIKTVTALIALGVAIRYWIALRHAPICMTVTPTLNVANHSHWFNVIYDKPYTRYGGLLCGVLTAYLQRERTLERLFASSALTGSIAAGSVAYLAWLFSYMKIERWDGLCSSIFMATHPTVFSLIVGFFLLLAMSPNVLGAGLGKLLSARFFYPIAQVSYSVYLIHLPLIFLLVRLWGFQAIPSLAELLLLTLACGALVFIAAAALYVCVERPFMELRPKAGGQHAAPVMNEQVVV